MDLTNLLILSQQYLLLTLEECCDEKHQRACQVYLDAIELAELNSPVFVDEHGVQWLVTKTGITSIETEQPEQSPVQS